MTRKKNVVNPDNIGALFLKDGEDILYCLTDCEVEPFATMTPVASTNTGLIVTSPVSSFSDFQLVRPPVAAPKKPRADKGGSHASPKKKALIDGAYGAYAVEDVLSEATPDKDSEKLPGHGQRVCPIHYLVLKSYPDGLWQCPQLGCDFEEKEG